MNILTVSHYFNSNGAGVEIVAGLIRAQLQKRGCNVRWLAARVDNGVSYSYPPDKDCVAIPMWDGIRAATDLAWPIPPPSSFGEFHREVEHADIIHLHEPFYPACQMAFWLAMLSHKPLVITQHIADMPVAGFMRRNAVTLANLLLTRPAHRLAKSVVFVSERSRRLFYTSAKGKDALIYNGCDTFLLHCVKDAERE
ncbi:MAG: glycosyltransferase, partial [Terrimicrobiaceae bacterium]